MTGAGRPEPTTDTSATSTAPASTIFVKSGTRTLRLELDDLLYGSSVGDYLSLHLADGSKVLTLENLTDLVSRLPADRFCRIHRSHFVALHRIDFVERRRAVIGKVWLPVSDGYRDGFFGLIGREQYLSPTTQPNETLLTTTQPFGAIHLVFRP